MIAGAGRPSGVGAASMRSTVPEVGAWTGAEIIPAGSASRWPPPTVSPALTTGTAGAPRCCESEIVNSGGSGNGRIGRLFVACLL